MVITATNAIELLAVGLDIAMKARAAMETEDPQSIEEEIARLEALMDDLESSESVIARADKA